MENKEVIEISKEVSGSIQAIYNNKIVKDTLIYLEESNEITLKDQRDICKINAPSYLEETRAKDYYNRFIKLGLEDVSIDEIGNVIGYIKGMGNGPCLLISAHLDTVFKKDTNTEVIIKDGIYYAPGISDNVRGLTEVLAVARAIKKSGLKTIGNIMFCGNVCEEGQGDLKGIKHIFNEHKHIDGYMTPDIGTIDIVRFKATGSHRYKVTFKGSGGHSFNDFGIPSAIHAMGRAISSIADLQAPINPKTTFTIGHVEGGTSINTIAEEASMLVDIRSNDNDELLKLEKEILREINNSVTKENNRWKSDGIKVTIDKIGTRPAGALDSNLNIIQTSSYVSEIMGLDYNIVSAASTDANIPISLGIPAIQVGIGGRAGGVHTLNEWYDPKDSHLGPQKHFLTVLALVGVDGLSSPLLEKRMFK